MAVLILTFVIVLAIVGVIAALSPDPDADRSVSLSGNTPPNSGDEHIDEEEWPRHLSFHMDWVETAAHGKRFNPSIDDDMSGFDF